MHVLSKEKKKHYALGSKSRPTGNHLLAPYAQQPVRKPESSGIWESNSVCSVCTEALEDLLDVVFIP